MNNREQCEEWWKNIATTPIKKIPTLLDAWLACAELKDKEIEELQADNDRLREALEVCKYDRFTGEVIGIAKEPVGCLDTNGAYIRASNLNLNNIDERFTKLYTEPQPREWKGLNDKERKEVWNSLTYTQFYLDYAEAIEAKLKELNK